MSRGEMVHTKTLPFWYPAVILAACAVLFTGAWFNATHLPTALTSDDEPNRIGDFIAERAQNITQHLADLGPKVPGSMANRRARDHLLERIEHVRQLLHPVHRLEVDVQTANGSVYLGGSGTAYANIENVVVRLSAAGSAQQHALLLNSHYDSVSISDGAGDDTFMVSIMLEVLRVLASSYITHKHAIVFLFNGAEEDGLLGAHAFVTQHRWAAECRAFINMDSAGSGGREMLFQMTPGSGAWLMGEYKAAVPRARANVMFQDLFESGLVPSDTDFRIFRDFGRIAGVDLATISNGYVYHTRHDRPEIIPLGSYQSVGDNVLELTRALANAKGNGFGDGGAAAAVVTDDVVFFDFLGWFMISYTLTHALIINLCVGFAVLGLILLTLHSFAGKCETTYLVMLAELGLITAVQLITVIVTVALTILCGFLYDAFGRPLSWLTNVWLSIGLYGAPLLVALMLGPTLYFCVYRRRLSRSLHLHKQFESIMLVIKRSYHVQLFLHAQAVLLVVTLIVLSLALPQARSAYMIVIVLACYGVSTLVNYALRLHVHDTRWVYVHLVAHIPVTLYFGHMFALVLPSLAAIQGRSGSIANPEYTMGGVCFLFGWLAFGLLAPVLCFVRKPLWWVGGLMLLWLVTIGVMFTPVGFPYREATSEQRFWVLHTDRTFHTLNGTASGTSASDHGYWLLKMDRNAHRFISSIVPGLTNGTKTSQFCDDYLYCGLPLHEESDSNLWLPTEHASHSHTNATRATLALVSNEPAPEAANTRRYTFELSGPDKMNVFLSPNVDNRLVNWTFFEGTSKPASKWQNDRDVYYLFLDSGDSTQEQHTWRFFVDIAVKSPLGSAVVFDIAVAGHYMYQRDLISAEFKAFLATFPRWAHVNAWISSYESWQY